MIEFSGSRRAFLLGVLLAGVATFDGGAALAVATGRHRRRRRIHHKQNAAHAHSHAHAHGHARAAPAAAHSTSAASQTNAPSPTAPAPGGGAGGGAGAGGGGGGWSDRRLKRAVRRIGVSPSGLPIYSFQYVWGGPRHVGVMAQDLLRLRPDAVVLDASGYMKVDYGRLDVKMTTLEAFERHHAA